MTLKYLRIKVIPNAPKSEIMGMMEDNETLKIKIKAPPEKGKANTELIKLLAKEYGVKKNCVNIVAGGRERVKLVKIEGEV